jgi:hypothetical protein
MSGQADKSAERSIPSGKARLSGLNEEDHATIAKVLGFVSRAGTDPGGESISGKNNLNQFEQARGAAPSKPCQGNACVDRLTFPFVSTHPIAIGITISCLNASELPIKVRRSYSGV